MRQKRQITREDFDSLLGWLSPEREEAARKYEHLRRQLIRYFRFRGSSDPEILADETLNRVALKASVVPLDDNFNLPAYIHSFAERVFLEDCKQRKRHVPIYDAGSLVAPAVESEDASLQCMEFCLRKCSTAETKLLIRYYGYEKSERAGERKLLAAELQTTVMILHTKISRLRKTLRECLEKCLNRKKM